MIVLDTDHISVLQYDQSEVARRLSERLQQVPASDVAVTAVTLEEQTRGWINILGRQRDAYRQVPYYARFTGMFEFFADWQVLAFDMDAAAKFFQLRTQVRIGSTDLKIASIALVKQATVLTRNARDFEQVADLHIENWIDE